MLPHISDRANQSVNINQNFTSILNNKIRREECRNLAALRRNVSCTRRRNWGKYHKWRNRQNMLPPTLKAGKWWAWTHFSAASSLWQIPLHWWTMKRIQQKFQLIPQGVNHSKIVETITSCNIQLWFKLLFYTCCHCWFLNGVEIFNSLPRFGTILGLREDGTPTSFDPLRTLMIIRAR